MKILLLWVLLGWPAFAQQLENVRLTFHTDPPGLEVYRVLNDSTEPTYLGRSGEEIALPAMPEKATLRVVFGWKDYRDPQELLVPVAQAVRQPLYPVSPRKVTLPWRSRLSWEWERHRGRWLLLVGLPLTVLLWWARRRQKPAPAPETASAVGGRLGRFELRHSLGRGGFGEVFEAVDDQGQAVAVKVLRQPLQTDDAARKRFFREIQVLSRLDHPHIVRIYDWGEEQDCIYLVMELLQGSPLSQVIRSGYGLDREVLAPLVAQLGSALAALHAQGLVHRDLKPDNLFLQANGKLKLMDFGTTLALDLTRATVTGQALGTPSFMAPEQLKGELHPATDQYALGVIAFLCLTGKRPFEAEDPMALAYMHAHTPAPLPSSLRPSVSPELDAVLLRLLAKQPEQRYADIEAACAALGQALAPSSQQTVEGDDTISYGT